MAIDFDVGEEMLYWTDVTENAIYGTKISFSQDGGHPGKVSHLESLVILLGYLLSSSEVQWD